MAFPERDTGVAPVEVWAAAAAADRVLPHLVVEADLDENRHANNVSYVAWAWEALGRSAEECSRLDVDYLGEALLGDRVEISCWDASGELRQLLKVGEKMVAQVRWVRAASSGRG